MRDGRSSAATGEGPGARVERPAQWHAVGRDPGRSRRAERRTLGDVVLTLKAVCLSPLFVTVRMVLEYFLPTGATNTSLQNMRYAHLAPDFDRPF